MNFLFVATLKNVFVIVHICYIVLIMLGLIKLFRLCVLCFHYSVQHMFRIFASSHQIFSFSGLNYFLAGQVLHFNFRLNIVALQSFRIISSVYPCACLPRFIVSLRALALHIQCLGWYYFRIQYFVQWHL